MVESLKDNDVKELLGYLNNIKSYEREFQLSEKSTLNMIWGLFVIVAGIADFTVAIYVKASPHGIIWFTAIAAGFIAQRIITSQPLLFEKEYSSVAINRQKVTRFEVSLTFIIMAITLAISWFNHNYIMPYIGIVFGTANLISILKMEKEKKISLIDKIGVIGPFYLSALLIVILGLIDNLNFMYAGLIFGIFVGGSVFLRGYTLRKQVTEFNS